MGIVTDRDESPVYLSGMFSDSTNPHVEAIPEEAADFPAVPEVRQLFRRLSAIQHIEHRPAGSLLFAEGEFPKALFMLVSGEVKVSMYSRAGTSCRLRLANSGEVIGLSAAISGRAYDSTAETTTPSTIAYIRRDDFLRVLEDSNEACFSVLQLLSRDISSCYELMRTFCGDRAKCS